MKRASLLELDAAQLVDVALRERQHGETLARATRALAMGFTNERIRDVVEALKPYNEAPAHG